MSYKSTPLSRREFARKSVLSAGAILALSRRGAAGTPNRIPLGGPVFGSFDDPEAWARAHLDLGYAAAYCPAKASDPDEVVQAYAKAAASANLIIAEVGAWSNPISPNAEERDKALQKCREQLALADRIGARCCVNISGSRNAQHWDGPDPLNLTPETFDMIVESTRAIIDFVKPTRTFFTLETMPWAYPDSVESYERLIKAIDRKRFAVHLDPVNLICSPQRYYGNADLIRECFKRLGAQIKSVHAKDILLSTELTTHLDEVIPGNGGLDYTVFLREMAQLPGVPLMLEHLKTAEEYQQAASHVRRVAAANRIAVS